MSSDSISSAIFPIIFWGLPMVLGALIHNAVSKQPKTRERKLRIWLLWFLGMGVGFGGMVGFLEHWLMPDQMAELIGFKPSFFQYEVAIANLACGVLGLLCLKIREPGFWLATIIANAVWFWGDAVGHIFQYEIRGNTAAGNIGGPLIIDILQPAILFLLYAMWRKADRKDMPAPAE